MTEYVKSSMILMLWSRTASEPTPRNFLIFHNGSMNRRVTIMFAASNALANRLSGKLGLNVPISTPNPTLHMESKVILINNS
ncbi:hypothetical protein HanIR_Chr17g0902641 [Helianthus annuus]|nr:hypothetical protein HanIR_Chr17g0902641 [Helianthus annuus]